MSGYVALNVDGEPVETRDILDTVEGFRVQVESDAWGDSYDHRCEKCHASVDSDGTDESGETECPDGEETWAHDDETYPDCGPDCSADGRYLGASSEGKDLLEDDHYTREVPAVHAPVPSPLSWWNSSAIDVDPNDNSVTVTISVGDPRGAFAFTVRQVERDDEEPYLIMHTPYPGQGWAHMPLTALHEGTYRVMPYGWTAPKSEPEPAPRVLTRWERVRAVIGGWLCAVGAYLEP